MLKVYHPGIPLYLMFVQWYIVACNRFLVLSCLIYVLLVGHVSLSRKEIKPKRVKHFLYLASLMFLGASLDVEWYWLQLQHVMHIDGGGVLYSWNEYAEILLFWFYLFKQQTRYKHGIRCYFLVENHYYINNTLYNTTHYLFLC